MTYKPGDRLLRRQQRGQLAVLLLQALLDRRRRCGALLGGLLAARMVRSSMAGG